MPEDNSGNYYSRRFVILYDMGQYAIVGFDDGEIGMVTKSYLRKTPPDVWRSREYTRAESEPGQAYYWQPKDPLEVKEHQRRRFDSAPAKDIAAKYETLRTGHVIRLTTVTIPAECMYEMQVAYSAIGKVWVCSKRRPQKIRGVDLWGTGVVLESPQPPGANPPPPPPSPPPLPIDENLSSDVPETVLN